MVILTALEHLDLHECTGFLREFIGRGALAGLKAQDHRAFFDAFAGSDLKILADIVALVEQADGRHPFGHRGRVGNFG